MEMKETKSVKIQRVITAQRKPLPKRQMARVLRILKKRMTKRDGSLPKRKDNKTTIKIETHQKVLAMITIRWKKPAAKKAVK